MGSTSGDVKRPGMPLPATTESGAAPVLSNIKGLWSLTYIKFNSMKTTILHMPDEPTTDIAVERAKEYCKTNHYKFSWMEPAIVTVGSNEISKGHKSIE